MKLSVTITKDDDFKTIGVEIFFGKKSVFQQGLSCPDLYWTKTIYGDDHIEEIVKILDLKGRLEATKSFSNTLFDICKDNEEIQKAVEKRGGINITRLKKIEEEIAQRIKELVAKLEEKPQAK